MYFYFLGRWFLWYIWDISTEVYYRFGFISVGYYEILKLRMIYDCFLKNYEERKSWWGFRRVLVVGGGIVGGGKDFLDDVFSF